jgi:hypothetical protein
MGKYIYLTSTPEALVASMLPPEGFGLYLSTGTKKRNKGQTIFFEVNLDQIESLIDINSLIKGVLPKKMAVRKALFIFQYTEFLRQFRLQR